MWLCARSLRCGPWFGAVYFRVRLVGIIWVVPKGWNVWFGAGYFLLWLDGCVVAVPEGRFGWFGGVF